MAALFASAATTAFAQQAPAPEQAQPATTTVEEPIAEPKKAARRQRLRRSRACSRKCVGDRPFDARDQEALAALFRSGPDLPDALSRARVRERPRFPQANVQLEPWDRTTVLLKDFGDYGNAAARSSPNNAVLLDVAPLSQSMETFTPGERFFTLTNHELAHVATMDVWNKRDAFWRKFLSGKPMPIQEHPELILWNYLSTSAQQRSALVSRR